LVVYAVITIIIYGRKANDAILPSTPNTLLLAVNTLITNHTHTDCYLFQQTEFATYDAFNSTTTTVTTPLCNDAATRNLLVHYLTNEFVSDLTRTLQPRTASTIQIQINFIQPQPVNTTEMYSTQWMLSGDGNNSTADAERYEFWIFGGIIFCLLLLILIAWIVHTVQWKRYNRLSTHNTVQTQDLDQDEEDEEHEDEEKVHTATRDGRRAQMVEMPFMSMEYADSELMMKEEQEVYMCGEDESDIEATTTGQTRTIEFMP